MVFFLQLRLQNSTVAMVVSLLVFPAMIMTPFLSYFISRERGYPSPGWWAFWSIGAWGIINILYLLVRKPYSVRHSLFLDGSVGYQPNTSRQEMNNSSSNATNSDQLTEKLSSNKGSGSESAMSCSECSSEVDNDSAFCPKCGHQFTSRVCSACQALFDRDSSYCPYCGVKNG